MARSYIDRFIYSITKKPRHYIDVQNPPKTILEKLSRPQDARQVQYNKWSKSHQIYSGSYLPYRHKDLSKQGWIIIRRSSNKYDTEHIRKTTGQHVLRHGRHVNRYGNLEPTHYHWINHKAEKFSKKKRSSNYYYDKFGNICSRGSRASHLKPYKRRRRK